VHVSSPVLPKDAPVLTQYAPPDGIHRCPGAIGQSPVDHQLWQVDVRLPGKGKTSMAQGRSPIIISMIQWILISRWSIKNSLPAAGGRMQLGASGGHGVSSCGFGIQSPRPGHCCHPWDTARRQRAGWQIHRCPCPQAASGQFPVDHQLRQVPGCNWERLVDLKSGEQYWKNMDSGEET